MIANTTDIDLDWSDPFDIFNDYPCIKVIQVVVSIIVLILGTCLLLGMISYEKYGEDPQKRGLFNQILSQIFAMTIVGYSILIPFRIARLLIGPFSEALFWIWVTVLSCFTYSVVLCTTEYSVIKFISIVVKRQVLPLVDDFFGRFFFGFNTLMSIWLLTISAFTTDFTKEKFKILGLPDFIQDTDNMLPLKYVYKLSL